MGQALPFILYEVYINKKMKIAINKIIILFMATKISYLIMNVT
jgi:hypothetical protein